MVGDLISLASYGYFGGGAIGEMFAQWEASGIFSYALPFLLIFALVFGLLTKLNIFASKESPNKGINAIIALAVALMALQFNVVSIFFAEIFPRMGIALSLILAILILGGIFIPTNKKSNWFMVTLVIIIFGIIIVVIYNSMRAMGYGFFGGGLSFFLRQYWGIIVFVIIVIAVVATTSAKRDKDRPRVSNVLSRALLADEED